MEYQYGTIEKVTKNMNQYYRFGDYKKGYKHLVDLLNYIGQDGWELVGQVMNEGIIVKRVKSDSKNKANNKENYILDRVEKALYMGFLLDKKSNDYLSKSIIITSELMINMLDNYNSHISNKGYPINLRPNTHNNSLTIRTMREVIYLNEEELIEFVGKLESRISNNIHHSKQSYTDKGIEVFDLDLLVELERTGVTTMGDSYMAFNRKKYWVNFAHLEKIAEAF